MDENTIETLNLPVLTGDIVRPGEPEWDLARRAWNLAVDQRPALVALPADAEDVRAIVAYAIANRLKIAPQGTGHNASPIESLDDTILLSTQRMRGVEIDVDAQTARVRAGTLWLEVTEAATPHGLYPLSGSSPDVGVVGYTLGGGLSWLGRKHGLACNHVTAIELVTPGGTLVRATADEHADLFWALRGGGGSFGIVTAMEFRLFPYASVYGGMLLWPFERHAEVLRAWHAWTRTAPEDVTTAFRIMHLPPLPDLPPFLSGRSVVVIDGAYAGSAEDGAEALAPLRALEPEIDTFAPATPEQLSHIHMDPEEPVPYLSEGMLIRDLDEAGLEAFAGAIQAPLLFGELRHLGGALGRAPEGAGALGALAGDHLLFGVGLLMAPDAAEPIGRGLDAFKRSLAGYDTGSAYPNFVEHPVDAAVFYTDEAWARLRAIRGAIDPDGRMVANHPIPAA
jgi:FAD/FMN-containing dehydrogenase